MRFNPGKLAGLTRILRHLICIQKTFRRKTPAKKPRTMDSTDTGPSHTLERRHDGQDRTATQGHVSDLRRAQKTWLEHTATSTKAPNDALSTLGLF